MMFKKPIYLLHPKLLKLSFYKSWHDWRYHNHFHWAVFLLYSLAILALVFGFLFPKEVKAAYQVRSGHPRIFITADDIPKLAARVAEGGPLHEDYVLMKQYADSSISKAPTLYALSSFPMLGLIYLIEKHNGNPNATNYSNYIKSVLALVNESSPPESFCPGYDYHGTPLVLTGLDWIWETLSQEEKIKIHNTINNCSVKVSNLWWPGGDRSLTDEGHFWTSSVYVSQLARLMRSLLLYGEGIDDPLYAGEIEALESFIRLDLAPAYNVAGKFTSGFSYAGGREYGIPWLFEAVKVALGEDFWPNNKYGKEWGAIYLYSVLPYIISEMYSPYFLPQNEDGSALVKEPDFAVPRYFKGSRNALLFAKNYQDPYAQWWVEKQRRDYDLNKNFWPEKRDHFWMNILWYDSGLKPVDLNTIPLARHLAKGGKEIAIMRTGWGVDDTYIAFHAGDSYYGHQHAMVGHFDIHKKGRLAIDAGTYLPSGGETVYGSTMAHNTLLIYDPDETKWSRYGNHIIFGGQFTYLPYWATEYDSSDEVKMRKANVSALPVAEFWDRADITEFETSSNYDYVEGDCTRPYIGRVDSFIRKLVFLRPDYVVVFDRVAVPNASFGKYWLLHMMNKPEVNGTGVLLEDKINGTGEKAGVWRYDEVNFVSITDGEGKLFLKPLLPENIKMWVLGGPHIPSYSGSGAGTTEYYPGDPNGYEYWNRPWDQGNGKNLYFTTVKASVESGWGRLEIKPVENNTKEVFLNVLYPTDITVTEMPPATKIESLDGNMVGAFVDNHLVMFGKEGKLEGGTSYKVSGEGLSKHLIVDLKPNLPYEVKDNGNPIANSPITTSENGTLSFDINLFSEHTITLIPSNIPVITLTKSVDKANASKGDILTYTITYKNVGNLEAKNAIIEDRIPDGTTYQVGSATNNGNYDQGQNKIIWNIGNLPPGQSGSVSFKVKIE